MSASSTARRRRQRRRVARAGRHDRRVERPSAAFGAEGDRSPAGWPPDGDELGELLAEAAEVRDTRRRIRGEGADRDRRSGLLTGVSLALTVLVWLASAGPALGSLPLVAVCVAAYAAAAMVEFEIGSGAALPTTPVLLAAAFLVPAQLLPVVALGGLALSAVIFRLRDPQRRDRPLVVVGSAWYAVGFALVFGITGSRPASLAGWPIYLAALGTQFAFDAAASWVRNCYGLGVPTRRLLGALRFTFLVDLLLAPLGVMAAIAAGAGSARSVLLLMGPIAFVAMLQRDRRVRIDQAVALGTAVSDTAEKARTDVLTGLRNRLAWEEAVSRLAGSDEPIGVVMADVDGLKAANDSRGHETGDRLIVAVARVLESGAALGVPGAFVARLGGDEFGILLPGELAGQAPMMARSLRGAFAAAEPIDATVPVRASVGVSIAPTAAALPIAFLEADLEVNEEKIRSGARRR